MTKIIFDFQIFSAQQFGGISRYYCELADELTAREGLDVSVLAPFYINEYLGGSHKFRKCGIKVPKIPKTVAVLGSLNRGVSSLFLGLANADIFHETYYSDRVLRAGTAKRVLTVLDMIHEKFPQHFSTNDRTPELKRLSVERADHIICISESTRKDLIDILRVPREKTSVVYLGHSFHAENSTGMKAVTSLQDKPYILFVGPRGGYKDFKSLLEAFSRDEKIHRNFRLICAGGSAFSESEQGLIRRLPEGSVAQLFATDDVLASLYSHANAFVYPSLYEGFGIPPLEAMSYGCPVITTSGGSLPEVVGDAAEVFPAGSVDGLANALNQVLFSEARRQELKAKGFERVKRFTWATCADETLKVYNSL